MCEKHKLTLPRPETKGLVLPKEYPDGGSLLS